tara:strand:- start:716 stop:1591 length:876 start_codon:yes stop_codon:yes gene_type:complete
MNSDLQKNIDLYCSDLNGIAYISKLVNRSRKKKDSQKNCTEALLAILASTLSRSEEDLLKSLEVPPQKDILKMEKEIVRIQYLNSKLSEEKDKMKKILKESEKIHSDILNKYSNVLEKVDTIIQSCNDFDDTKSPLDKFEEIMRDVALEAVVDPAISLDIKTDEIPEEEFENLFADQNLMETLGSPEEIENQAMSFFGISRDAEGFFTPPMMISQTVFENSEEDEDYIQSTSSDDSDDELDLENGEIPEQSFENNQEEQKTEPQEEENKEEEKEEELPRRTRRRRMRRILS